MIAILYPLDIACFIAAPHAATIMGEFGADVIKVEHPKGGDPWRRYGTRTDLADQSLAWLNDCLLYTSPSPRDGLLSRMPSSA